MRKSCSPFSENCSWEDAKEHIAQNIHRWVFTDRERMFAATDGGTVIATASVMKTDYYPIRDISPWVSSIFVTEAGMRSAKLCACPERSMRFVFASLFPNRMVHIERTGTILAGNDVCRFTVRFEE